jgi:transposase-like protein
MELNFKSLPALLRHFKDEAICLAYLEKQRWDGVPTCPCCNGTEKIWETNRGYKCGVCLKKFTVKCGTIFENTKVPLNLWFAAIYLATAHKKGISSLQLHRDLGVTQKTAWFMMHRIREIMKAKNSSMISGQVQADETFVGGKNKNRHSDKKVKESQGRSTKDKTPVFGLLSDGKVSLAVVVDTKAKTLKPIIKNLVEKGAILVTDEWGGYAGLKNDYQHEVIKHNEGLYTKNGFHTNSIEGFWSLFKRGIFGIYHYASPKHLHRYCNEFSYRYNSRKITDTTRFTLSFDNINTRLTYKKLINK